MQKSGFVTIIGETNSGKSTLLNNIIQNKISIVSHKVQTTRYNILGILTKDNNQIVFIDTPGIFKANRKFDTQMINSSYSTLNDADIIMLLIDAKKGITEQTLQIIKNIPKNKNQILVINKIDLLKKVEIINLLESVSKFTNFSNFFAISATKNNNIEILLNYLFASIPEHNWYFNKDDVSNQSLEKIAAEITREKIYLYIHQELPYNISVEAEKWIEESNKTIIYQQINISKESYKPILLGKNSSKIKSIRMASQKDIQKLINKPVNLFLHIKVNNKWLLV